MYLYYYLNRQMLVAITMNNVLTDEFVLLFTSLFSLVYIRSHKNVPAHFVKETTNHPWDMVDSSFGSTLGLPQYDMPHPLDICVWINLLLLWMSTHIQKISFTLPLILEVWNFQEASHLIRWEHFGSLINDENFAYHSICDTGSQEINKFSLRIVFRKIKRKVSKKYTKYIFRPYFAKIRAKISCLQKLGSVCF